MNKSGGIRHPDDPHQVMMLLVLLCVAVRAGAGSRAVTGAAARAAACTDAPSADALSLFQFPFTQEFNPKKGGINGVKRSSSKSLGRLWWDEIVPTAIGRMMIHSHRNLHPGQFRSLSVTTAHCHVSTPPQQRAPQTDLLTPLQAREYARVQVETAVHCHMSRPQRSSR